MKAMMLFALFLFFIFALLNTLVSLFSPSSLMEFRKEGRRINRELVNDLKKLNSREDVIIASPRLQKRFFSLVELIVAAKEYQENHPFEPTIDIDEIDVELNAELLTQLNRIYSIEGTRELMEKVQESALHRLSSISSEKGLTRPKQSVSLSPAI